MIVNPRFYPVLDIECNDMGSHVTRIGEEKVIPSLFYEFERTKIPDENIIKRLRKEATKLYKKIGDENIGHYSKDNITCIMRYSKGCMSKLYYFIIRSKFMYQKHPNLNKSWVSVFKYKQTITEEQIRNMLYEHKINTNIS